MHRLSLLCCPCLILLALLSAPPSAAAEAAPNILFIIGDDHAAYALGAYGHKAVKTPHMDALAAAGMRFTRAYCNAPVCTPSRQSFLTGRLPHAAGVTQLTTPLAEDQVTLADHLGAAGYTCAAFGKMHFNSKLKHGFAEYSDFAEVPKRPAGAPPFPEPDGKLFPPWRPFKDPASVWLNSEVLAQPVLDAESGATKIAQAAAEFLQRPQAKPFFLIASFHQPHSPFQFPADFKDRVDPASLEFPAPVLEHEHSQVPLIFRALSPEQKRGIAAAYYTSVNYLDTKIGTVLQALEKSGHAENTVVFYFGDHGYTLGHHGRFEKHCFYEEAIRVPLLVRWPRLVKAGSCCDAFVELVDLFPTVCELARTPLPPQRDGRSLLPLLNDATTPHRAFIVSQYNENEELMIRTDEWKLVYCSGQRVRKDGYETDAPAPGRYLRLYNIRTDPQETRDRSREAGLEPLIQSLQQTLLERLESSARADDRERAAKLDGVTAKLDYFAQPLELRSKAPSR